MYALQTAGGLPDVSERHDYDGGDIFKMIEFMQLGDAISELENIFPVSQAEDDEQAIMKSKLASMQISRMTDYENIHKSYIQPLRATEVVVRTTTLAIAHAYGAYGWYKP